MRMPIHESGENYLETILRLQQQNGFVRAVDIAGALGYTKASISRAVRILKEQGYQRVERSGRLALTEAGKARAEGIYERHRCIARFLMRALDLDEETADSDACRIEHVLSEEAFARMRAYLEKNGG